MRRKLLQLCSYRQKCSEYMNGVGSLKHNAFSTEVEHLEDDKSLPVDESPELPDWIRFPVTDVSATNREDDDFVPPSISYWIENHKIRDEVTDAKRVVRESVESDIDKVSKILKSQFKSLDSVVQALNGCDVNVSDGLVEKVLRRFNCEWMPSFGFVKWAELQKGGQHSPEFYNSMIDILGKARRFDIVWELMEDMKRFEGYITLNTMTKIMRRLAKAGRYEDAVMAFENLQSFGVEKDMAALSILMDALVKEGSVELAERVFSNYKMSIPPTLYAYNILVHGWCRSRQIDKAKRTLDEMKMEGFHPDAYTYTGLIEAYCHEKDFRKVDATLGEMQEKGCRPSIVTYTIVIKALAKAKEMNKAMKVYDMMKENNCPVDAAFYTAFINALGMSGRLKDADAVFEDMSKQGIALDTWTYNALIFIAARNLQEEKALKFLMKMEESRCKPDLNTYVPLLKMCCTLNRMKVLSFLLSHMFKNDVSLDLGAYSLLVNRLCKNGNPKIACLYFKELLDKGFVPMDCTQDTLIKALEKKDMYEEKQEIEDLMSLKNITRMAPVKGGSKSKSKN